MTGKSVRIQKKNKKLIHFINVGKIAKAQWKKLFKMKKQQKVHKIWENLKKSH